MNTKNNTTKCIILVVPKMHYMSYWIIWKRTRIDISVYLLVDFFKKQLFSNEMMRLWRLSIMLENSLIHLCRLLVLVNSRRVNCDSLMELGQSSTSANHSRFPEACLKRRSSVSPCTSECYFWSFRGLSCLLRTILVSIFVDNFYNAFFW